MTAMQLVIQQALTARAQWSNFANCTRVPEFALEIHNPPYMALHIERLYMPDHGRQAISIAHYFTQNGDAMRDPEMCFDLVTWQPLYFRQDGGFPLEQYVWTGPDRKAYYPRILHDLQSFANTWARNLRQQGFIQPRPAPDAHLEQDYEDRTE